VPCRRIVYNDLQAIAPEQYFKQITKRLAEIKAVSVSRKSFYGIYLRVAYNATHQ
jgi:solute carrier family 25 aspartate/glutamate transporter 12/13